MGSEEAISRPSAVTPRSIEAFGETKTIAEWAEDPRCLVPREALSNRLDHGWEGDRALTDALREHDGATAWGESKSLRSWARDPRARAGSHGSISRRLEQGWTAEQAISTPPKEIDRAGIAAFGETKSQTEWTRDPRCRVTLSGLRDRLTAGMSPEAAITTAGRGNSPLRNRHRSVRAGGCGVS